MALHIETGAWVSDPDVDPQYWTRKAQMEAELRATEGISEEEIEAYRTDGVYKRVLLARRAVADGRLEELPMTIRITPAL